MFNDKRSFIYTIQCLLRCFQIFGLYIGSPPTKWGTEVTSGTAKKRWLMVWERVFCFLSLGYLVTYSASIAIRLHFVRVFTPEWVMLYNLFAWCVSSTIVCITAVVGFGQGKFYKWCESVSEYEKLFGFSTTFDWLLRKLPLMTIMCQIFSCVCFPVAFLILLHYFPMIADNVFWFGPEQVWEKNITMFLFFLLQATFYTNISVVVFICTAFVYFELQTLHKQMELYVDSRCKTNAQITNILQQHLQICGVIDKFNGCIKHHMAFAFLMYLPLSCFHLYLLLTSVDTRDERILTSVSFATVLTPVAGTFIVGSLVNTMAHKSLGYVWRMPTSELSKTAMRNLMLFTSRLTGTTIGYDVCGFFTISLPAVLSITGTLMTYFIVVIQSKPLDKYCNTVCDGALQYNLTRLLQAIQNETLSSLT